MGLQEEAECALTGDHESQDTQYIVGVLHQQFGVGFTSSSPSQPIPLDEVQADLQRHPRPPKVHQRFAGTGDPVLLSTSISKPNAGILSAKMKTIGTAKSRAEPRGRSTKVNPAATGSCKGKAKGMDTGSRTNLDASRSRASFSPHHPSSSYSSRQATPPEIFNVFESAHSSQSTGGRVQQRHADTAITLTVGARSLNGIDSTEHPTVLHDHADGSKSSSSEPPKLGRRKMDPSQSPTQSNDGRSYEQYISRGDDLVPNDPVETPDLASQQSAHTCHSGDDNRTLNEDDTGAVIFRDIDNYNVDFSAHASPSTGKPPIGSPDLLTGNPETPASHKNPFAGSKAHLLPASQLFGQTQVSSAYKVVSPTSSRPSPDNFQLKNSISPNLFISSPLKNLGTGLLSSHGAVSSPQLLVPYVTSPPQPSLDEVGLNHGAPEPRPLDTTRTFSRRRAEVYEPLYLSPQDNDPSSLSAPDSQSDEYPSEDDEVRRRHRAMLKKAKVENQLSSIIYERPSHLEDIVVPSTNTGKVKKYKTSAKNHLDQCAGTAAQDSHNAVEDSQELVVVPSAGHPDSQDAVIDDSQQGVVLISAELEAHVSGNDAIVMATLPNMAQVSSKSPATYSDHPSKSPKTSSEIGKADADPVPETSPAAVQPRKLGEMLSSSGQTSHQISFTTLLHSSLRGNLLSQSLNNLDTVSPGNRSCAPSQTRQRAGQRQTHESTVLDAKSPNAIVEGSKGKSSAYPSTVEVTETGPIVGSSPPLAAFSTRAKLRDSRDRSYRNSPAGSGSLDSTLSALTTTPVVSNKTTPLTEDSPAHAENITPSSTDEQPTSPSAAKAGRRKGKGTTNKPKPAPGASRNLRMSMRRSITCFVQDNSVSTDGMARSPKSPTPTAFEQSARLSKYGRTLLKEPPVSQETRRGGGGRLFAGMAFAISFQAKQPGERDSNYNSRIGLSSKVADQIKQGGGRLLANGFDQLFEFAAIKSAEVASSTPPADEEIKLSASAKTIGFAALIADGHSRKVKYMQALALGLPCIHERWITTCFEKQELVDWSDYLLCAGNSSFLGDAVRSRNLPSYDAASAKLSEVIDSRPRLLRGSRILLVLRRQDESKKMAYVFLARVLGASLSRVYTIEEANRQLKANEDAGHPYDWVYVEENTAGKAALFADDISAAAPMHTSLGPGRKRKRKSEAGAASPAPKKIRTLSNELMIQSLILGRLLEEGEII